MTGFPRAISEYQKPEPRMVQIRKQVSWGPWLRVLLAGVSGVMLSLLTLVFATDVPRAAWVLPCVHTSVPFSWQGPNLRHRLS